MNLVSTEKWSLYKGPKFEIVNLVFTEKQEKYLTYK